MFHDEQKVKTSSSLIEEADLNTQMYSRPGRRWGESIKNTEIKNLLSKNGEFLGAEDTLSYELL